MNTDAVLAHEHRVIKTFRMLELEKKHSKPIRRLVVDAYNKYGFRGTCDFLSITRNTLANWLKTLDIVTFQGAIEREKLEELGLKVRPRQRPTKSE